MKKFFSGFLVLCLSLALLTACGKDGQTGKTVAAGGLTFAKSYSEVYSALTDAQKAIADRDKSLNMTDGASDDPESGGKGDGEGEGTFYSGTNVQVARMKGAGSRSSTRTRCPAAPHFCAAYRPYSPAPRMILS